jgi:protein-S-isoprenylcysteine O-methyltransferase Ste14
LWHWTPWQGAAVRWSGVTVYVVGLGLRLWSMRTLRRAFSYGLKVAEDQALVTSGPYRVLRHPSYTGLILWSAGCAVWNPSVPGLVLKVYSPRVAAWHASRSEVVMTQVSGPSQRSTAPMMHSSLSSSTILTS